MISGTFKKYKGDWLFLISAVLLWAYTISRAWILSFTFDESYSYMSYVKDTYYNIFSYHFLTSNNHALNSLLMKLSTEVFAASDFTLRWHSLFGHLLFLVFSWASLKDIHHKWFRLGAFFLLNLNPFVLDFFSLARGYGLGLGLMMGSLYYCTRFFNGSGKKFSAITISIIFAGLAAMANFTMLNFMLALMGASFAWAVYIQFRDKERAFIWKTIVVMAASSGLFLWYVLKISLRLKQAKELYYGGRKGLWIDTVSTLIDSTLYFAHYLLNARLFMQVSIIAVLSAGLLFIVYKFIVRKEDPKKYASFLAVSSIFFTMICGIKIQHMFLNTYYLVDRTALLLIPVFVMATVYLMYHLFEMYRAVSLVFILFVAMTLFHFGNVMNFEKTETWPEQADVKIMMRDLDKIRMQKDSTKKDFFLSPFWFCGPAADFYRDVYHYDWLKKVEVRPPTLKENYFYFPDSELTELGQQPYRVLKKYPRTHYLLLENLKPTPREIVESGILQMEPGEKECEGADFVQKNVKEGKYSVFLKPETFSPALKFPIGNMLGDSMYRVEASVWVYFDSLNVRDGELVIAVSDSQKIYKWTSQNFGRYFDFTGHWMHVYFGDWMPKVLTAKDEVTVSVYNKSKRIPFYVDGLEAKVIK